MPNVYILNITNPVWINYLISILLFLVYKRSYRVEVSERNELIRSVFTTMNSEPSVQGVEKVIQVTEDSSKRMIRIFGENIL